MNRADIRRFQASEVKPPIRFYVPVPELLAEAPQSSREYWPWISDALTRLSMSESHSRWAATWIGPYNWTIQSCLYLREAGLDCQLTSTLPETGIVVTHTDFLPTGLIPSSEQFFVALKPDRLLRRRFANFIIVQNERDPLCAGWPSVLLPSAFVRYWPQPGLVGRDPSREDRFETICFMGNRNNFLPEVDALRTKIRELGLTWLMPERGAWHDYSRMDAVVAVRPPETVTANAMPFGWNRKPASKLCNAWLAGVPAILSPDSAFRDLRRSRLDFIEAQTIEDIVQVLVQLKRNPSLRRAMIENGHLRAREFSTARIAGAWKSLFQEEVFPAYARWARSRWRQEWFSVSRRLLHDFKSEI